MGRGSLLPRPFLMGDDMERERRVSERAYFLWCEAGCPEGRAVEFWELAEGDEAPELEPELRAAAESSF